MKRVILIILAVVLSFIAFVMLYLIRIDITKDDFNDILADTKYIDVCRNMDQDNDKLTECSDDNNALIATFNKDDEMFSKIINMYTDTKESNRYEEDLVPRNMMKYNHFYKVVFKDENNNLLAGATLGCVQSFFKINDTYYNMDASSFCGDYHDEVFKYLRTYDATYEEYYNKFVDILMG